MNIYPKLVWPIAASFVLITGTAGAQQTPETEVEQEQMPVEEQTQMYLEHWNEAPREKAQELIERYGQPDEVTSNRFIWHDNDWWKRMEIVNEEIAHNFPEEHHDFLYQTIDYNVPAERAGDVVSLSGSLIIDRVKGELTSRCDSEEHNLLALNLAHQVLEGQHSVESARDVFAQARLEGQHADLMERLTFTPEQLDPEPADPGIVYGARPEEDEQEPREEPQQ